ncbi:hypothetical protein GH714_012017 [Hevea brasiliensis]|uniref:Disease resistance protein At4g27190-like leucine-rich repeats domain-containing protein n=1 Tax=Hevea brasiliensis TaxID=3981 RepID=A0A6A6L4A7_HEVBR|nr:hypothetical protein GH714_012017 [Hevea brasiliensis]
MEVCFCPNMEAIVIDEDQGSNEEVVEFNQLRSLKLYGLPHLRSFRSNMKKVPPGTESRHKQILTADETAFEEFLSEELSLFNRMVTFSNLEKLRLSGISEMKKSSNLEELFSCEGFTLVRNLELFAVDNLKQIWDEDSRLKPVLEHLETLSMKYFQASKFPALWHGGIQGRLFHNVQLLTVDQCAISDIPVPANLLQFLNKLEELEVKYCDSAEIVFDLEGLSVDDGTLSYFPN